MLLQMALFHSFFKLSWQILFVVVVQLLSPVQLFATSWAAARQALPSFTISRSLLKLISTESVMPSNHLILCHPPLFLPSIFPSIRVFSDESVLHTEKAMTTHSSTLAWKIPWMEESGRLQSMGLRRVRHDCATSLSLFTFMCWRRRWQPIPVFLPGESQGQGSLVGCRLWGRTESDTTEAT